MPKAQHPIVLPDPEMVLMYERLPPHDEIRVVSDLFGGSYKNLRAMIRARSKVERTLNEQVTEVQRVTCIPGCHCYFEVEVTIDDQGTRTRLPVFGDIPTIEVLGNTERLIEADAEHARNLSTRVKDAHRRGWLFGKWHSTASPNGEWGAMHISMLEAMLPESFHAAQGRGWTK